VFVFSHHSHTTFFEVLFKKLPAKNPPQLLDLFDFNSPKSKRVSHRRPLRENYTRETLGDPLRNNPSALWIGPGAILANASYIFLTSNKNWIIFLAFFEKNFLFLCQAANLLSFRHRQIIISIFSSLAMKQKKPLQDGPWEKTDNPVFSALEGSKNGV